MAPTVNTLIVQHVVCQRHRCGNVRRHEAIGPEPKTTQPRCGVRPARRRPQSSLARHVRPVGQGRRSLRHEQRVAVRLQTRSACLFGVAEPFLRDRDGLE